MLQAVHTDRSGRVIVAADYGAAGLAGPRPAALERAVPLPADAQLVPLADRAAVGIDRRGLPRPLGPARWALGAVLGPGHLRTHLPASAPAAIAGPLEPLPYAAVAADPSGALVVAAVAHGTPGPTPADPSAAISARLRAEPSNRLLRQLARCARDHRCPAAAAAFGGGGECALPLGAPAADASGPGVALRRRSERAPLAPSALAAPAADCAAIGAAHLAAGGMSVSFGHACEGEPLAAIRRLADVTARIRAQTPRGSIVLRTGATSAAALLRAADAGVDALVVALASAHGPTYERIHRPVGHRWSDVRAALRAAAARRLPLTIELLTFPGLSDRASEVGALLALLAELPAGTALRAVDLACDPDALRATLPPDPEVIGIEALLARLRSDAAHVRLAA